MDPVQYGMRLLVPPGSLLLETRGAAARTWARSSRRRSPTAGPIPIRAWTRSRPRRAELVARAAEMEADAPAIFDRVRAMAAEAAGAPRAGARWPAGMAKGRKRPPRLTEAWFC